MTGMDPHWYRDGRDKVWLPYTNPNAADPPLPVVATDGVRLKLADGRELIDGIASWWTAIHGYNHPHIIAAMKRQLEAMPHVMFGGLVHEPALQLAARLTALAPGDLNRVFFADSGSVSVEIAMKMTIQYWLNQGISGRSKFVGFNNGYHGDTMATMSVGDPGVMHGTFSDALARQFIVELPDDANELDRFDGFLARVNREVAGVLIEPLIQGAGGMKFHSIETLQAISRICARYDLPLIADEIFTGFGRTGHMFASEAAGVTPDILCLSKSLTGGAVAQAAVLVSDRICESFGADDPGAIFNHGPTFMANPLACAAANASLDLFESEPRLEQVARIERHFTEALRVCHNLPGIRDVRACGAVGVIQVAELTDLDWLKTRFVEEGIWLRPFGDVIYLTPPYMIGESDLKRLSDATVKVVREWAAMQA